jgi:hypothetical protein
MSIAHWYRRKPHRDWHDVTTIQTDYGGMAEPSPTLIRVVRDFIGRQAEPLACAVATVLTIAFAWRNW